ncbi:glycoside hydrolase family 3 protein [Flavilitoribacter nigricans]|uniref:beta-glucosidase n=1 Tax=Flavilitoribacter nigricans (strain ATCC 23147 / DSM 23189 / NBRC 102662 / NCIMB 1420 / SS-2) TaxID=1122177 RepID=A0A2D0N6B5_FLAN2|nr:glycoside hydrolase family 3 N-terminal domain-containing protein [Flavilitoribacter nigricans]PHN03699.1 beta-glucosidase [Flavilitoribacter nigricans DSM 23189 = NBRC 102662]
MKQLFLFLLIAILTATIFPARGQGSYSFQPDLGARTVPLLHEGQLTFKDLNKNQKLDLYEDWRQSVDRRIENLVGQMTLQEKVGMMLINTLNAESYGRVSDRAVEFIEDEKMTRFIFRNTVTNDPVRSNSGNPWAGTQVTPFEAAQFMNAVQELAENTRLGIPLMFKSNARNHMDYDARAGINVASGAFSAWPKENGLAATRDMDLIADFAKIMAREWKAIGLRGMYGYMADLSTEPRWYRIHETFTEDSDLASDIITTLVTNLQGTALNSNSIALTIKHFPGGGPQENGGDPHYDFGKNQVYPSNNFDYHVAPFRAAIDAGASSIMAYYGIPVGQPYLPNTVGMAFSKGILTELLRQKLGFKGYINSDTGIIGDRAWGLEDKSVEEQILIAIDAGTDILSGFNDNQQLLDLVKAGKLSEERVDQSVSRLLREQFELGLFENPFVDPNRAAYVVGNASFQRKADLAQRKSIVLLQNKMNLPVALPKEKETLKLFTVGMNTELFSDRAWTGVEATSGDYSAGEEEAAMPAIPKDTDYAIVRVNVTTDRSGGRRFGGVAPEELDLLSFSEMAKSKSWIITPSLEDIQTIMETVGAENTILSIDFRQPYVLDEASGLLNAGAILATFGVSDAAVMDILTGKFKPTGKLPFALANKPEAITRQDSDAPGYPAEDTLFPFGFGLTFEDQN